MTAATSEQIGTCSNLEEKPQVARICSPGLTLDICIGWIDPARMTRECMTQVITRANPRFGIVPYETAQECVLDADPSIDLLVYFLHRPDAIGFSDVLCLRTAFPNTGLVLISDTATVNDTIVRNLLLEGVSGFLHSRRTSLEVAVHALTLVVSGGSYIPKEFLFLEAKPEPLVRPQSLSEQWVLTPRELAVLNQVRDGQPNKVIARQLGVRPNTVKVHIRNIMRKMGTRNRTQAAVIASRPRIGQSFDLN